MLKQQKHTYSKNLTTLTKQGLYDPTFEHDACGVGLVANIDGTKSHHIINQSLEVLINLGHRGAAGADPETGDGAGIMIQMPDEFFRKECAKEQIDLPNINSYGTGIVFLPTENQAKSNSMNLIENTTASENLRFLGWRKVPINLDAIGTLAGKSCPVIYQFFVTKENSSNDEIPLELRLYLLRRQIEKKISAQLPNQTGFYICSLSSKKIVYKGLLHAHQVSDFYTELKDPTLKSGFGLVHSRFSTNTLGAWHLAHPYRYLIHNGEINTLRGNINWMAAREKTMESSILKNEIKKLTPIIPTDQSDTASLDNVVELLLATGRSLPHVMMMVIPEAWGDHIQMDPHKKAFYEYHASMMEPWDGPALVIASDGESVCAILDRNGLRPARYLITTDNLLVMASETGVLNIPPSKIQTKGRVEPGKMFLLDTKNKKIVDDTTIKHSISNQNPYTDWIKKNRHVLNNKQTKLSLGKYSVESKTLLQRQIAFGYTLEDIRIIIEPMVLNGTEPIGSMGNDTPVAVLSQKSPLLFNYFKQLFAQVSNPPLDAIREELVTSVETYLGSEQNLFTETPQHVAQLLIKEPILTQGDLIKICSINTPHIKSTTLSMLYKINTKKIPPNTLAQAINSLCKKAEESVKGGTTILILSDKGLGENTIPIPSLLATSSVHHHLIKKGLRTKVGLIIESGEPREVSHFALLLGYGAGAIHPYLLFETAADQINNNQINSGFTYSKAEQNIVKALHKGIVKVMSKMGISTLQSYSGAQIFEAVGLNKKTIDKYFTWTQSRIGGIGLPQIQEESLNRHNRAYGNSNNQIQSLDLGGYYQWRRGGEHHDWNPSTIEDLQFATNANSYDDYKKFASKIDKQNKELFTIRGLLEFKKNKNPIPLDEIEPSSEIVKRFATGAISLGSISKEAHETLAIAMNRIKARSNTGEGGEDLNRYTMEPNGDSKNSAIKQVASGRFGVTSDYLASAKDLQIKMAQGSKPGEGGQLPGHKIDDYIGWVRSSTPGVELISPPPHHDIYSIEDLAQLIHDLKNANPESRIHVKLVSEACVGTIAAGVSKGHGDVVLISGDSGGTGASPESSIKTAGLPWELGLAETQQVLVMNDLRNRIVVQTDGQLKTGRDVAIACLLGAEEFGFATAPLITLGCIMLRKCHMNTCSVGIATQDKELRKHFTGTPEAVINYFYFIAQHLREIMSELGFRTINEMIGRADKLNKRKALDHWKASHLDLSALVYTPDVDQNIVRYQTKNQDHSLTKALDQLLIKKAHKSIQDGTPSNIESPITNQNRTVGTMLSYHVSKKYGHTGLPSNTISVNFKGSAGQSFAAFLAPGIKFKLEGDANDYFCKGLSGGEVIVKTPNESILNPSENVIIGNVALYGATRGNVFINGKAGERFAVRNSGANAVVEGVGDHGCEYMTGGRVVILGPTGRNFAAGMSGGIAYVIDPNKIFESLCNKELVELDTLSDKQEIMLVQQLIEKHYNLTNSKNAQDILQNWNQSIQNFVRIIPHAYKRLLSKK